MNETTQKAMSSASDDLKALLRDAEQVLAGAGDVADEKVTELRQRMRAALDGSSDRLERLRETAREQADRADEYVRSHPYQSIGVAAAVGALIGILFSRRW